MAGKRKAAPRKRGATPKVPAEPLTKVAEPKPVEGPVVPAEPLMELSGKLHIVYPDGLLLQKDGDPVVYVMNGGQRRPFANADAFLAYNHGWSGINVLPAEVIDPIPQGPEVTGPADLK